MILFSPVIILSEACIRLHRGRGGKIHINFTANIGGFMSVSLLNSFYRKFKKCSCLKSFLQYFEYHTCECNDTDNNQWLVLNVK